MNKDQEKKAKAEPNAADDSQFSQPSVNPSGASSKVKRSFTGPKAPIVINEPVVKRPRGISESEQQPAEKKVKGIQKKGTCGGNKVQEV